MSKSIHSEKAIELLKSLVAVPSFSKEESGRAQLIFDFLTENHIAAQQHGNNICAFAHPYDPAKPTLLLNSHIDTVRPVSGWTKDPFEPVVEDGKLFGLGSNDAGGALTAMIAAFLHFSKEENVPLNLLLAATAEEEISGKNGIESILPLYPFIDAGIVGEPTLLKMAVAEKGLLVLDCIVRGKAGHAAREEGENAIYKAMKSIEWFRNYRFPEKSEWLGEMKMNITMITAGSQHNIIPDECRFTVDIRVTDSYSHEEVLEIIRRHSDCEIVPRSTRLRASSISENHPLVLAGKKNGLESFGSPTLSDQALLPFPTIKFGPGDSARSHTADEFIFVREIEEGIEKYISLIKETEVLITNQGFEFANGLRASDSQIRNHS